MAGCTQDDGPAATAAPATKEPVATEPPEPETTVYTGTVYVAGMGGHFAKVAVEIDPTNTEDPITVSSLKRVKIGDKNTHPTHDPRVDAYDSNTMFWSTYNLDGDKVHVGKTDLSTGKVVQDVSLAIDDRVVAFKGALYCASGQSKDSYIPVMMSHEGYLDVFSKADLSAAPTRVFLDGVLPDANYKFFHGTNTPDLKSMVVTVNTADKPAGTTTGETKLYLLNMAALESGIATVEKTGSFTGGAGTISFRQDYTPDGSMLLQSAADRFVLLDSDFNVLDEEMMREGAANHDAISTADGKYAILTVRQAIADKGTDGQLQLYDIEKKEMVGNPVSTCYACHDENDIEGNAVLCGADVVWDEQPAAPKVTYTGDVYVAGMGGHFAKATVTVDPSAAQPLTVDSLKRVKIGDKNTHPTHDPRIDVTDTNNMFWSTYLKDASANNAAHVGVSDLSTGKVVTDVAIPLDARVVAFDGALYCASGQTTTSYMPVTMTHEAYIDVFSKANLNAAPKRVFLDGVLPNANYKFFHGTNTRDMKNFVVAVNTADKAAGTTTGETKLYLLDMADLEAGKATLVRSGSFTGSASTISFRQSYTYNGEMLLQSAADRFYLLDADDFSVIDEEMMGEGAANHDAIAVPGGKYAILTVRQAIADKGTDGQLQLYDMEKMEMVGDPVSTCYACHDESGIEGNAVLCGADVVWR